MRIFAVDENNDMHLAANGHLALRSDLQALIQACEHVMQAVLGEMAFSDERGLPYRETVWETYSPRLFEDAARLALRGVQGVQAVESFACEAADNTLRYQAVIRSAYGVFTLNKEARRG